MAITIQQNPGSINQAYGVNAVSLSGLVSESKYVLRVKKGTTILADIRQAPNIYGNAIFDIQNILQTYVSPGDTDIDTIGDVTGFVPTLTNSIYNLYNVGSNTFIGANTTSPGGAPVSSEVNGSADNTKWTFTLNGQGFYNIDSIDGGILRATGPSFNPPWAIVSTNFEPPIFDNDKEFKVEYNASDDTYKIRVNNTSMYIYYHGPNDYRAKGGNTSGDEFKFKFISKGPIGGSPQYYRNSFNLGYQYDLEYGTETGGVYTSAGTLENFEVYPGRKEYYEVDWDINRWSSVVSGGVVESIGLGLTDNQKVVDNTYTHTIRPDDYSTISYLQKVNSTDPTITGISKFSVSIYDASDNLLASDEYPNILSLGGGPYNAIGDAIIPEYPYGVITFGCGPKNLMDLDFTNAAYYVVTPITVGATDLNTFYSHKFIIDRGICLDYNTIQFSWMNSLGVRDYYTFTKKNERSVRIRRQEYLTNNADYNGITYQVGKGDRGTVTYGQTLQQEYIANTDYISDEDAVFLESLFVSPDVRVRFEGDDEFLPVTLTSTSYTERTFRKDQLFQYEVRFKMANNLKSQRG